MKKIIKTQMDISELKRGIYLIELSDEINKTTHKLIVKKWFILDFFGIIYMS